MIEDRDVADTRSGKVLDSRTAQTACPDDEDFGIA